MFRSNIFDEIEKELDLVCGNSNCVAVIKKPEQDLEGIARLPVADVAETENSIIATFELPGVSKEEIELNVTDDRVEVKVERKVEKKEKLRKRQKKKTATPMR
ncbi:Hsp20/alpha crystallin family protein [Candidatus Woesearchaeota archaeon]|nr:Hsp20/alpha crystallin family protein [Candidatus Woesearchaeota archaeon]